MARSKKRDALREVADLLLDARVITTTLIKAAGKLAQVPVLSRLAASFASPLVDLAERVAAASRLLEDELATVTPTDRALRYA